MSPKGIVKTFALPDGREISIETGRLAKQADGAVVVRMGDAMLLATVVSAKEARPGLDFLPLSVDYQEKFAASGRIPGSFQRREARLSDYEILISRLVDRALRPLFPKDYHADVQVLISLISADKEVMPDALAGLAASAALTISDIPFNGPISEVRVAKIDGEFKVNPTITEIERAEVDFLIAGSELEILMVEGEAKECSEQDMIDAIKIGHEAIKQQVKAQLELRDMVGAKTLREYSHETNDPELKEKVKEATYSKVYEVAKSGLPKEERSAAFKVIIEEFIISLGEDAEETTISLAKKYYHDVEKEAMRDMVINEGIRLDGRNTKQIRPIWSEIGYLPSTHGSAIFTRGETQSLTTVTLGAKTDEQIVDGAMFNGYNKFLLHYNFPPFSTGEARPMRGVGRREVGHGNLAMRSIKQVLPPEEENPYTLRIVSDVLESNGSSSMATVCASSLALMDAGVKIKAAVSGIAMGMISDAKSGKYAILSDILGDEDHLGDMDFKVTGTEKGITGCQMDLKVEGLSFDVMMEALLQAKEGRLHILNEMNKTIAEPQPEFKPHTPRIIQIIVDREFIGAIIGPGGKVIQEMQRETGATINIEEVDNKGIVQIFAAEKSIIDAAVTRINNIIAVPDIGATYEGIVKNIQAFGAFVEFMPGKDGLLHISEIDWKRYETMDGVFEIGDKVTVKLLEVDKKTGKFKLSRKALIPRPEGMPEPAPRENRERSGDRGGRNDRNDRGNRR